MREPFRSIPFRSCVPPDLPFLPDKPAGEEDNRLLLAPGGLVSPERKVGHSSLAPGGLVPPEG